MTDSALWVFFVSTLTLSTPLLLAAMGGLVSERSGIINIALEGKMLGAAAVYAIVGTHSGSNIENQGNEMRLRTVVLADFGGGVRAGSIEVAQRNARDPIGSPMIRQNPLDHELG